MTKSGKHCGKRRNCTFCAISSFVTMFSKGRLRQKASTWGKGLKVNPFPQTTNLQHLKMKVCLWRSIKHYEKRKYSSSSAIVSYALLFSKVVLQVSICIRFFISLVIFNMITLKFNRKVWNYHIHVHVKLCHRSLPNISKYKNMFTVSLVHV